MRENYQSVFIEILKRLAPGNLNLAEEVSQLLGISADSTYRRLRGETELTLNETVMLCRHFDIPLEALNHELPDVVTFKINKLSDSVNSFSGYLDGLEKDLINILKSEGNSLHYAAEDLPLFYHFFFPELARFKMIYWTKSIMNVSSYQGYKVEDMQFPDDWVGRAKGISELFAKVPTIEIWNEDTIKSTLQQIKFYWEAGFFKEKETMQKVMGEFKALIDMVHKQAEVGHKYNPWKGQYSQTPYSLYISDLMIGNNCVFFSAGEKRSSYIGYNSFNYMRTANHYFNDQVQKWLQNLIGKSTLVSAVAEKHRNQFFKEQMRRTDLLLAQLSAD
jgi:hypothetical protein